MYRNGFKHGVIFGIDDKISFFCIHDINWSAEPRLGQLRVCRWGTAEHRWLRSFLGKSRLFQHKENGLVFHSKPRNFLISPPSPKKMLRCLEVGGVLYLYLHVGPAGKCIEAASNYGGKFRVPHCSKFCGCSFH